MSRLKPKSESGGTKIWKSVKGVCRVSRPKFLEWKKNQRVRCKKPFENWLRVSGSKLNVSESELKKMALVIFIRNFKQL